LGKIAEVAIGCPKLGDAVTNADSSDPGVVKPGADDRCTPAQLIKNVEMAL
jgi:hypothetical protein